MRLNLLAAAFFLIFASTFSARATEMEGNDSSSAAEHAACLQHQGDAHSASNLTERRDAMAREIEKYQLLVEEALSLRAEAIRFHQKLQEKMSSREPLSGFDLLVLNQGATSMLAQRDALFGMALQHECWTSKQPAEDPQEAAIQVAGVAMSLSAALVLYDNYLAAIAPYRGDQELRRQLNRADKGFNRHTGALDEISLSYASVANRQRMRRAISWLQRYHMKANNAPVVGYRYVQNLIEQSPSLAALQKDKPINDMFGGIGFMSTAVIDRLFDLKDESTNFSSLIFGTTIGLVEVRHGKLYRDSAILDRVTRSLKAGDILVEKTPFRLTDSFIPGHWGHAAVWIGTESELRTLGIWDHPVVKPHQEAIRTGHGVVEALRSGVEINTMAHFMNIDDLAILRHETLSAERRMEVILLALRQIGKSYDFNFDAETTNRIFCSKLVYLAYGDLQWPTSRILGRITVSPDNIASRAFDDGPLNVVMLYHDGQEITENRRVYMQRLMQPAKLALK